MMQTSSTSADCNTGSLGAKIDYSALLPDSAGNCVAGEVDGVKIEYYESETCGGSPTLVHYVKSGVCFSQQKMTCDASNEKVEMGIYGSGECGEGTPVLSASFSPDSCEKIGGDGGNSYGNTCPEKQYACEGTGYLEGFEGGCESCVEDDEPEEGKCSTLLPFIQEEKGSGFGGCYWECARKNHLFLCYIFCFDLTF